VPGCGELLEPNPAGKQYNIRYRLCDAHLRAPAVTIEGQPQRFCQARALPRARQPRSRALAR
jgi:hypothetical protein